jgi:predicted small lipoprotein YifL
MRTALARTAATTLVAISALTGCGDDQPSAEAPSDATQSSRTTTTAPDKDKPSTEPPSADTVVVDITIADGEVTPTGEEVEARVGEPIELHVDSDAADELHVHSQPEHSFEVEADPGKTQVFEFTVDIPGQVDVESHATGETIVTLVVRP